MSEVDKDYELNVLRMVINQHLDTSTSLTESSLNALEKRRDQFVWDITTRIYSESGHRVELSLVRDIVDDRIQIIKKHLAEAARRAAEKKAQQVAEAARREAEEQAQQEAEEQAYQEAEAVRREAEEQAQQKAEAARREAEEKARQKAEAAQQKAEAARREAEEKARQIKEARQAAETNFHLLAQRKSEIFVRVRNVISKQLSVQEEGITLNSHLSTDLSADPLDLFELMMALEDEFDIEIRDEDVTSRLDVEYPEMRPSGSLFGVDSLPPPFKGKVGEKAIVRNIVELIWDNDSYFWESHLS